MMTFLTDFDPEGGETDVGVADEEDRVEHAQRDEQLIEGRLHARAPQHQNGEHVADQAEQTHHGGGDAHAPKLPSGQQLRREKKFSLRFLGEY